MITPYQLNPSAWGWGAKTGFFWAGSCVLGVVFTYFVIQEPQDRTVAELDLLFEKRVSARRFARFQGNLWEAADASSPISESKL